MADPISISGVQQTLGGGQQSFVQRLINVQITLGAGTTNQPGTFASGLGAGTNTVTLSGHRTSVHLTNTGGTANYATIHIWGLNQSTLNELSQLGMIYNQVRQNSVIVSAGDSISGMTPVYSGTTYLSYADYNQQPEVPLIMTCFGGLDEATINAAPSTFSGVTDIVTLMSGWAALMNKTLEIGNIDPTKYKLANPYYGGNTWSKIQAAARDLNVVAQIDGDILAVWPKGGSRNLTTIPLISPTTGLIGYPTYSSTGYAIIKHLFNPLVRIGGTIKLQSGILPSTLTNAFWDIYRLDLNLESLVPHGDWMGEAYCYPRTYGAPPPVPVG